MLTTYFDESESKDKRYFVFAGYCAPADRWGAFAREWQYCLDLDPKVEYFHATELSNKSGQFEGWSDEDRKLRFIEFSRIVKRYVHCGLSAVIDMDVFDRLKHKIPPLWRHQYYLGYVIAIEMAFVMRKNFQYPDAWPMDIVFDENDKYQDNANTLVEPWALTIDELARLDHANDRVELPLQAADMLAWRTMRKVSEHKNAHMPLFHPVEGRYILGLPKEEEENEKYLELGIASLLRAIEMWPAFIHDAVKKPLSRCAPSGLLSLLMASSPGPVCWHLALRDRYDPTREVSEPFQ